LPRYARLGSRIRVTCGFVIVPQAITADCGVFVPPARAVSRRPARPARTGQAALAAGPGARRAVSPGRPAPPSPPRWIRRC